jgi:hypothetical protein
MTLPRRIALAALLAAGSACTEDSTPIATVAPPPDAGCLRDDLPRRYEVYFVLDVSGSMGPFLQGLADNLESFARAFPEVDSQDRPVLVNYHVVAFVNDVRWFPSEEARRMTDAIAVRAAIEDAVRAGGRNTNLNTTLVNAEPDENLLDALATAVGDAREAANASATLVMIATDAAFRENPETLAGGVVVQSTFEGIREALAAVGARVHAFTPDSLDGLTRNYRSQAALTTLPGSTLHSLRDLTSSRDKLRETLLGIAEASACN